MRLPFDLVYTSLKGYILELTDDGDLRVLSTKQNPDGRYLTQRVMGAGGYVLSNIDRGHTNRVLYTINQLRSMWGVLKNKADIVSGKGKSTVKSALCLYDLINVEGGIELYNATLPNIIKYIQDEYGYNEEDDSEAIEETFRIIPAGYGAIKAKIEVKITMNLTVED